MNPEELREIKFPKTELKPRHYVEWFLANGWHIELVEYKDEEKPAFVKTQGENESIGLNVVEPAEELCGLQIDLENVEEGQKVKIITNMTLEGFC